MPDFIKGLELSRLFFEEAVRPALAAEFPSLRYAAALLGTGSEVLGFDTEMSADHGWGPRVDLFLKEEDFDARDSIREALRHKRRCVSFTSNGRTANEISTQRHGDTETQL
jgi:hypothetical protein